MWGFKAFSSDPTLFSHLPAIHAASDALRHHFRLSVHDRPSLIFVIKSICSLTMNTDAYFSRPMGFPYSPVTFLHPWSTSSSLYFFFVFFFYFVQEAASLISQRAVNPREMFKQRERGITPSDSDVPSAAPASPQPGISSCLLPRPPTPYQLALAMERRSSTSSPVAASPSSDRPLISHCVSIKLSSSCSAQRVCTFVFLSPPPLAHCCGGRGLTLGVRLCSGRLQSPFLSKPAYESERASSPQRQASPEPAGSASPIPATGVSLHRHTRTYTHRAITSPV